MPVELLAAYMNLPAFLAVLSRMGGMLMFMPVIGALTIPTHVRILLAAGLAAAVLPLVRIPELLPPTPGALALALAGELLLGILIGVAVRICFVALEMGGQIIAQESGMAFAQVADPTTGTDQDVLGLLYVQLGAVVFLIVGGHRVLLSVCLDTFGSIPLLTAQPDNEAAANLLLDALGLAAATAVRLAAPALITLFLVNVVLGFIGRCVPQLNVTILGFSVKGLMVFALVAVSLPAAMEVFIGTLERVVGWTQEMLE